MGTIISKDTRRISFDNNISLNPVLIQSVKDNEEMIFGDFGEIQPHEIKLKKNLNYVKMHDEERNYWEKRIDHLKKEHQSINKIIEDEYKTSIEKTVKLFKKEDITQDKIQKLQPCLEWSSKIMRCYEDNPRQPLLCSAVVQAFNDCVASARLGE